MFYDRISRQAADWIKVRSLIRFLWLTACLNFFILALIGLALRSYPFISIPFNYKNLLHGHSHFAFTGWVMPMLTALLLRYLPQAANVRFMHWRNIVFLMLFSAYGMLGSFPFQGYAGISIVFSTLSIVADFYMAIVLLKATSHVEGTPVKFIRAGLYYLMLSAIGPLLTVPLIVTGRQGSTLYFDLIYFFLHFRYNGWFSFAVIGLLYQLFNEQLKTHHGDKVFMLLNIACIPTYFLSTLWHNPGLPFNIIGGAGAAVQLLAAYFLLQDLGKIKWESSLINRIMKLVSIAFGAKILLQFISAFPAVASLAYSERNFIIAYLHLVLLGFISMGCLGLMLNGIKYSYGWKKPVYLLFAGFISTELLLAAEAICAVNHIILPGFNQLLFLLTMLLPLAALWITATAYNSITTRNLRYIHA